MAIKRTNGNGSQGNEGADSGESSASAATNDLQKFRENAEVNGKIDAYIQKNPREWSYIQAMPRERLERSLVLQSVQKQERTEKMRASILKKLDENPEMKEAFRTLVKNLPAEQQEKAIVSLALRTNRTIAPPARQQTQGARV